MYRRIPYRQISRLGRTSRRSISKNLSLERSTSLRIIRPTLISLEGKYGEVIGANITEVIEEEEEEDGT